MMLHVVSPHPCDVACHPCDVQIGQSGTGNQLGHESGRAHGYGVLWGDRPPQVAV